MSVNSVSSSTLSATLQGAVSRLQSQLTTASSESATGQLSDPGLALGAEAGQEVALHQQMADLNAISSSNAVVATQLDTAANALTGLQGQASSMLQALIENASGTPGSAAASALQKQASAALQSFSSLANASVGGVYVFGGINSGVAPVATYAQTPASAAQTAVQTAFQTFFGFADNSPSVSTITSSQMQGFLDASFAPLFSGASWASDWSSASDTAQSSRIGAGETATTSVSANNAGFQKMAQALTMIGEFGGLALSGGAYATLVDTAQKVMNGANSALIETGAAVGAMQNAVSQASDAITLQQNVLTKQIDSRESVDPYSVASQVTAISSQLQTAYSLTAQIHKLSLVNFL